MLMIKSSLCFFQIIQLLHLQEHNLQKKSLMKCNKFSLYGTKHDHQRKEREKKKKRKIIIPSRLFLINFQPSCLGFPSLTRKKKPFPLLYKFSTPFQLDLLYSLYLRATFSPPVCKERKSLSSVSSFPSFYLSTFYFLIFSSSFFFFIPITQSEFQRCCRVRIRDKIRSGLE